MRQGRVFLQPAVDGRRHGLVVDTRRELSVVDHRHGGPGVIFRNQPVPGRGADDGFRAGEGQAVTLVQDRLGRFSAGLDGYSKRWMGASRSTKLGRSMAVSSAKVAQVLWASSMRRFSRSMGCLPAAPSREFSHRLPGDRPRPRRAGDWIAPALRGVLPAAPPVVGLWAPRRCRCPTSAGPRHGRESRTARLRRCPAAGRFGRCGGLG